MNEIKVTAEYINKEPSKFDALVAEYNAAKALADVTVSEKQPLIDAMGEAKLELIKKQLNDIAQKLHVIAKIRGTGVCIKVLVRVGPDGVILEDDCPNLGRIKYTPWNVFVSVGKAEEDNYISLDFKDIDSPCESWFSENGIVTRWNDYKFYEKLLAECEKQMRELIDGQNSITERINNTFSNMQTC